LSSQCVFPAVGRQRGRAGLISRHFASDGGYFDDDDGSKRGDEEEVAAGEGESRPNEGGDGDRETVAYDDLEVRTLSYRVSTALPAEDEADGAKHL